jgi:hypothetical protein
VTPRDGILDRVAPILTLVPPPLGIGATYHIVTLGNEKS